jgi:hypothetical protein
MTFKLIESYSLASDSNTIVFSVIPQTYKDLSLYVSTYGTRGVASVESYQIKPNGSFAGSYQKRLYGGGTSFSPMFGTDANTNELHTPWMGANASDFYNNTWFYFPNYASTTVGKCFFSEGATDSNTTTEWLVTLTAHSTDSTSAISSITLTGASFNFQSGTTASLYGIS